MNDLSLDPEFVRAIACVAAIFFVISALALLYRPARPPDDECECELAPGRCPIHNFRSRYED